MQQNYIFLLNADKTFLNMIHPARARELQSKGKAAVFRTMGTVMNSKKLPFPRNNFDLSASSHTTKRRRVF